LQDRGLPDAQLDRIRIGLNQDLDRFVHVFDAAQKGAFAKKAVIDGHVEAVAIRGKQAIHAGFDAHGMRCPFQNRRARLNIARLIDAGWHTPCPT